MTLVDELFRRVQMEREYKSSRPARLRMMEDRQALEMECVPCGERTVHERTPKGWACLRRAKHQEGGGEN